MTHVNKELKKVKKEIRKDIVSTKDTLYKVAEFIDFSGKPYYAIYNDKWPDKDAPLTNPDPEGREIVRSYGSHFANMLIIYRDIINSVFKVTNTTFTVHINGDVIIYNDHYRIRFSRNINAVPADHIRH